MDIVRAYNQVSFVVSALKSARDGVDCVHKCMHDSALQIAANVDVHETLPRTTSRQQHRSNVPASTASDYYKRVLTIPALDHLIAELEERFHRDSSSIVRQVMLLLPSTLAEREEILTSTDIADLVSMYADDLPAPASLDTELHCWSVKWHGRSEDAIPLCTPAKVITTIDCDFFPNIDLLLRIACTLAVTSAECERSVSCLHLKTYLRSTMTEVRLNGLALLYTHKDISCDAVDVVQEFAQRNPRRMQMQ